jgi:putative oxidoreductase
MIRHLQDIITLLARILLSQIFILSGVNHLRNWNSTIQYMSSKGLAIETLLGNSADILLAPAVAFLLFGGLSVLLGIRARGGAVLLILFLIPVTLIFHDFWNYGANDPQQVLQMINFMKNTGLGGGLLMVLAFGSGSLGLDAFLSKRRTNRADMQ